MTHDGSSGTRLSRRALLGLGGVTGLGLMTAVAGGANADIFGNGTTTYSADFSGAAGSAWPAGWTPWVGASADRDGGISTYAGSTDVAYVTGAGQGVLKAYKNATGWHSAFLYGPDFTYGTLTGVVKLPTGQGVFPAFWIVCSDCDSGGWPNHGEIDLIELVDAGTTRYTTLNFPKLLDSTANLALQVTPVDFDPTVFHTWSCEWRPSFVSVSLDGVELVRWNPVDVLLAGGRWCYGEGHSMKPVLNINIGADFPGQPDASTPSAVYLVVDSLTITP